MPEALGWIIGLSLVAASTGAVIRVGVLIGLGRQSAAAALLFVPIAVLLKHFVGLVGDEATYLGEALGILNAWQSGVEYTAGLPWTKQALSTYLAVLFFISVPNPYLGVLFLTPFFSALPILLGQSSWNFFQDLRLRALTSWITVMFPPLLMWSPLLLREGLSFFLLSVGVFGVSFIFRQRLMLSVLISGVAIFFVMFVRVQLTWPIVSMFAASVLCRLVAAKMPFREVAQLALSGALLVSMFVATQLISTPTTPSLASADSVIVNSEFREIVVRSNSNSGEALAVDSTTTGTQSAIGAFATTAMNVIPSLFGPFPWEWRNLSFMIAGFDGLLMLMIVVLALLPLVLRRFEFRVVAFALWAGATPIILGNALILANYGIAMRVRANVALILLPLAVYASSEISRIPRERLIKKRT